MSVLGRTGGGGRHGYASSGARGGCGWVSKCLLACLAVLVCASNVSATTYYVSQSGSNSNSCATATSTTQSNAKRNISNGIACLSPGDTLYIRVGTYTNILDLIDTSLYTVPDGTASARIIIRAYPGETVIIVPPGEYSGISLRNTVTQYVTFQFLKINKANGVRRERCGGNDGVYVGYGSNNNRFEDMEIYNSSSNGIQISDTNGNSPNNEVTRTSIHNNGQSRDEENCSTGAGVHTGYGMYISSSDNIFDGNDIYDNGGYGAHFYDNDPPLNGHRNIIKNNKWHGNGTHGGSNAGFLLGPGDGNKAYNNIVYSNLGEGIAVYTNSTNTLVAHNTIYGNTGPGMTLQYYGLNVVVANNLVYGNSGTITDYGGGAGSPTLTDGSGNPLNYFGNPSFTDVASNDFTLQSSSAAKDTFACVSSVTTDSLGVARPQGVRCDPGAYEITSSAPTITTTSLQDGQSGGSYLQSVCASGGTTAYAWDKSAGTFPTGVTLSDTSSTCATLSGTMSAVAAFSFTMRVTDALGMVDTQAFTVTVTAPVTTCAGGSGAWMIVTDSCTGAGSVDANADAVTPAITSVAAEAFFVVTNDQHVAACGIADSKGGNTWVLVDTKISNDDARVSLYRSHLTNVGASHTFSTACPDADSAPALQGFLVTGASASPLDQVATSVASSGSVSSLQLGSLTTSQNWILSVIAMSGERANTVSATGYAVYQVLHSWGHNYGAAIGWEIHQTPEVVTPTWTWSGAMPASSVGASFISSGSYVPKYRLRRR